MSQLSDRQQLIEEINLIPDSHLPQLLDLLHHFRLGLQAAAQAAPNVADLPIESPSVLESLAGSWEGTLEREPQGTDDRRMELE